jgi:hypothetical protein
MLECLLAAHWHAIARAATDDDTAALLCLRRTCRTLHSLLSYEMPAGVGDALIRPVMLERALREGDAAWALTLAAKPRPRQDTLAAASTLSVLQRVKSGEISVHPSVVGALMAGLVELREQSTINDPVAVMARSLAAMPNNGAADDMAAMFCAWLPSLHSRRCSGPGCVKTDYQPKSWALCPHCDYTGYCSPACRAADLAHCAMHATEEGSHRGWRMPDKSLVFERKSAPPSPVMPLSLAIPTPSDHADFLTRRWTRRVPEQQQQQQQRPFYAPAMILTPPPPPPRVQPMLPAAPPPEPVPDRAQRLSMGDYPEKLWQYLRARGVEQESFAVASLEWLPAGITSTDEDDIDCPCGHRHIHQLCHIHNRLTKKEATVGCDCIKWFDEKLANLVKLAQHLMKIQATYVGPSHGYNDSQLDFRLSKERKAFSATDVFRTFYTRLPWHKVGDKWHLYVNDARIAPSEPLEPASTYRLRLHLRSSRQQHLGLDQRTTLMLDLIGVERVAPDTAEEPTTTILPAQELVQWVGALSAAVPGHLAHTSNSRY